MTSKENELDLKCSLAGQAEEAADFIGVLLMLAVLVCAMGVLV